MYGIERGDGQKGIVMKELSLHLLDVSENSMTADADLLIIHIKEDYRNNILKIVIKDNGKGMDTDQLKEVTNPFFTTKRSKRVGLGLSLLKETCERCDGKFFVDSVPKKGTEIKAQFPLNHIDLPPLGNMAVTIVALILRNLSVDIVYKHEVDDKIFIMDTREIKRQLGDIPINHPEVIRSVKDQIEKGLIAIGAGKYLDKWRVDYAKANDTGS